MEDIGHPTWAVWMVVAVFVVSSAGAVLYCWSVT
jgi:hypothetical protein